MPKLGENGLEDLLDLRKPLFRRDKYQIHDFVVGKAPEDNSRPFGLAGHGRPA